MALSEQHKENIKKATESKQSKASPTQPQAKPQPQQDLKPNPKAQTGQLAKAAQARTAAIAMQIEALESRDDALCASVGVKLAEMVQARPAKIEAAFLDAMNGYEEDWEGFLGVEHLEGAINYFRLPSGSSMACLPGSANATEG